MKSIERSVKSEEEKEKRKTSKALIGLKDVLYHMLQGRNKVGGEQTEDVLIVKKQALIVAGGAIVVFGWIIFFSLCIDDKRSKYIIYIFLYQIHNVTMH